MATLQVSVVIPAYRAATTIRRAVDSVLAQTHPPHEIIVVDDGSDDDQVAVVEQEYGERVILVRQANCGVSSARNAGLERSTGDAIAFLDADDYWEAQKLERQLRVFDCNPEVGLVAARWFEQSPECDRVEGPAADLDSYNRVLRLDGSQAFHLATMVWTGTVAIRRSALGTERFCTDLEVAEDRDLWVRIMAQHPSYLMHEPLATVVLEPGSLTRSSIDRDCKNMLKMIERHRARLGPRGTRLWTSHTLSRWATIDSRPASALPRLMRSLWLWPLPHTTIPGAARWRRLKRMLVLLAIASGLRN